MNKEDFVALSVEPTEGEIVKLRPAGTCWAQYQVYATPEVHNY